MAWPKELQKSYAHQHNTKEYMIDCVVCGSPITPKERDKNSGMCEHCHAEVTIRKGDNTNVRS